MKQILRSYLALQALVVYDRQGLSIHLYVVHEFLLEVAFVHDLRTLKIQVVLEQDIYGCFRWAIFLETRPSPHSIYLTKVDN